VPSGRQYPLGQARVWWPKIEFGRLDRGRQTCAQAAFKGLRDDKPALRGPGREGQHCCQLGESPVQQVLRQNTSMRKGRHRGGAPQPGGISARGSSVRSASARSTSSSGAPQPQSGRKAGPLLRLENRLEPPAKKPRAHPVRRREARDQLLHNREAFLGVSISKPDIKHCGPDAGDGKPVTKLDLCRVFLQAVGEWMFAAPPRPPVLHCFALPTVLAANGSFQRHAMAGMSNLVDLIKVFG